jgi:predicted glycosyltransferase involved in capsule biosynthesis
MTNISASPTITAVIPVRLSHDRLYDECERIDRIIRTLPKESYSPLIVDYGSSLERAGELVALAEQHKVKLVRVDTERDTFSVGHARDIGTQHALTPIVMYHDIDFLMSPSSYRKVLAEVRLRDMVNRAYDFFALPGAYLTEDFTREYLQLHEVGDAEFADLKLHDGLMRQDKAVFNNMTYAISALVANRHHLLAIGGHDRSFIGHGAEDFDLYHRLTSYYARGPRPRDYYKNTMNNGINNYEGFRSYFALHGIDLFQRGLVIAHLEHPRRRDSGYVGTGNNSRVGEAMKRYDEGKSDIPPLPDLTISEKTLLLVKPGSAPARALRHAVPLLGQAIVLEETLFRDDSELLEYIGTEGVTQTFFLNPYGNEHRLSLYRAVKNAGLRFIAYDRGAFPESWFFDRGGFLGESQSYDRARWDCPMSDEQRQLAASYIDELRKSSKTLEKNGDRVGAAKLRSDLRLGDRKVIFVALQRPSDTATRFFSGPCYDAHTFNTWIQKLATGIDARHYVVVVKKHPLESVRPPLSGVVFAPDEAHINDLIELADKVVVINSGTGLIAAALGKPVICCGDAFYQHDGIAFAAASSHELATLAQRDLHVDSETCLRFVKYLSQDFYSYGPSQYEERNGEGGSSIRIATRILFSVIRGLGADEVRLGEPSKGVSLDAPLFYSFGGRAAIAANGGATGTAKPSPESSSADRRRAAIKAFEANAFLEAAKIFDEIASTDRKHGAYREAAEAYDRAGLTSEAIERLKAAAQLVPGNKNLAKRIREMSRPSWVRKLGVLRESRYNIGGK